MKRITDRNIKYNAGEYKRLQELENAIEDGRILYPPLAIGDTMYCIVIRVTADSKVYCIETDTVKNLRIESDGKITMYFCYGNEHGGLYNKVIFGSEKEALKEIKRRDKNDKNRA